MIPTKTGHQRSMAFGTRQGCRPSSARKIQSSAILHASSRYLCTTRNFFQMNTTHERLQALFNRIPRRHTADNVKEIYSILDAYEDVLKEMEADEQYSAGVAPLFEPLGTIRATVKNSNSPKAYKKGKDDLFDEASSALKDEIEAAMKL